MKNKAVLLVAAECAPLAKTGGLADVVGALPAYLAARGWDCRVVIPYHRCIKNAYADQVRHLEHFEVTLGWRHQYVGLELLELDGIKIYLLDNEFYFGERIYWGGDREVEQYAWFSRAVCEALPHLDFKPSCLHLNDWHTASVAMLLKTQYHDWRGELPTLLTIHNIAYQGKADMGFIQDLLGVEDRYCTSRYLESYGAADLLKAGCVFADRINVPSPTNAKEVCTAAYGNGLEGVLSGRGEALSGILNGIDCHSFDPAADPALPAHFTASQPEGKAACKRELLRELGLHTDSDVPLFGMVSRLVHQKGVDLLLDILPQLMEKPLVLAVVGTGEGSLEAQMRAAEHRYKGRLCAYIAYGEGVSRRVYAGSDFFLMPSRFEPCGLAQMIAMRYGSLPIVRETGGLKDTVIPYNRFTGEGNGLSFANYASGELLAAIERALELYADRPAYARVQQQAMATDFSFGRPAAEYARLYSQMLGI